MGEAKDWRATLARIGVLASALDSDYTLHRDLALNRAAVTARDLAQALDLALGGVPDRDHLSDRATAGDLDLTSALARYPTLDLAHCLDRHSAGSGAANAAGGRSMPGMVRVAVRLLPRSWQPRYREEYRAELARLRPQ